MKLMQKIRTVERVWKHLGLKGVMAIVLAKMNFSRRTQVVNALELQRNGFYPQSLSSEFLEEILGISAEEVRLGEQEFSALKLELTEKSSAPREQYFDSVFDLGMSMGRLLYLACRTSEPTYILETGVAAGMSSTLILSALEKNNKGHLISLDISSQVGELIPDLLRNRWTLKVLPLKRQEVFFRKYVSGIDGVKIFLHDSDHSDYWQKFEFDSVFSILEDCSIFLFDDVSLSLLKHVKESYPLAKVYVLDEGQKYSAVILRS
jgi:predicted O-methyltransferase YrrM